MASSSSRAQRRATGSRALSVGKARKGNERTRKSRPAWTPASRASYEANAPVARGDDTTDGLLRLVYLLRSGRFYWSQQVGLDIRGGDAPDGFPIYTEVGYSFGRVTGIGFYSLYLADGGTDIGDPGFTFPSNQEEYERLGAKLAVDTPSPWSLFAGAFTTLDGRNVGNTDGLFFGAIVHF